MTENHNNSNNLDPNTQNDLPKPPAGYQANSNNEQTADHRSNETDSQHANTTPQAPIQAKTLDVTAGELTVLQSIKRYSLFAIVGSASRSLSEELCCRFWRFGAVLLRSAKQKPFAKHMRLPTINK